MLLGSPCGFPFGNFCFRCDQSSTCEINSCFLTDSVLRCASVGFVRQQGSIGTEYKAEDGDYEFESEQINVRLLRRTDIRRPEML
jgi:hypothetical protein